MLHGSPSDDFRFYVDRMKTGCLSQQIFPQNTQATYTIS